MWLYLSKPGRSNFREDGHEFYSERSFLSSNQMNLYKICQNHRIDPRNANGKRNREARSNRRGTCSFPWTPRFLLTKGFGHWADVENSFDYWVTKIRWRLCTQRKDTGCHSSDWKMNEGWAGQARIVSCRRARRVPTPQSSVIVLFMNPSNDRKSGISLLWSFLKLCIRNSSWFPSDGYPPETEGMTQLQ